VGTLVGKPDFVLSALVFLLPFFENWILLLFPGVPPFFLASPGSMTAGGSSSLIVLPIRFKHIEEVLIFVGANILYTTTKRIKLLGLRV